MPQVSIILTVYNNKNDIMNAINSILAQTYKDWELVIVNDGSTDGLYATIKNVIEQNKDKIVYIENPTNIGRYPSLNEGIIKSKGKYICIIDSDDTYDPSKIEIQVNFLNANPKIVGALTYHIRAKRLRAAEVTLMFRKEIINRIGYYDSVRFAGDSEFIARIRKVFGWKALAKIRKVLYYVKIRQGSLTKSRIVGIGGASQKTVRCRYVREYRKWHLNNKNPYMPYPLNERPFPVDPVMIKNSKIVQAEIPNTAPVVPPNVKN